MILRVQYFFFGNCFDRSPWDLQDSILLSTPQSRIPCGKVMGRGCSHLFRDPLEREIISQRKCHNELVHNLPLPGFLFRSLPLFLFQCYSDVAPGNWCLQTNGHFGFQSTYSRPGKPKHQEKTKEHQKFQ